AMGSSTMVLRCGEPTRFGGKPEGESSCLDSGKSASLVSSKGRVPAFDHEYEPTRARRSIGKTARNRIPPVHRRRTEPEAGLAGRGPRRCRARGGGRAAVPV